MAGPCPSAAPCRPVPCRAPEPRLQIASRQRVRSPLVGHRMIASLIAELASQRYRAPRVPGPRDLIAEGKRNAQEWAAIINNQRMQSNGKN